MAFVNEQHVAPQPILPPAIKAYFERFKLGRAGLDVGRKFISALRKLRDPIQRKVWISRFGLPLRNTVLFNRPIPVPIDGISVSLTPRGATAADIWAGLRFEGHEVSLILEVLEPGMTFFDIGANAGVFSISAAKKIGSTRVYAFEPCSSTCALLKQNLRLNGVTEVSVEQVALGDTIGEALLQVNDRGRDGLNTLGRPTHPDSKVIGRESVRITTVDDFMSEHHVARVDVMKADIEGAELMMFRGAKNLLQRPDAPMILYEGFGLLTRGFGYHPVEILWLLESYGFTLLLLNSDTGRISVLKPDYQYDSMVIAVKPGHPAYAKLCGVVE